MGTSIAEWHGKSVASIVGNEGGIEFTDSPEDWKLTPALRSTIADTINEVFTDLPGMGPISVGTAPQDNSLAYAGGGRSIDICPSFADDATMLTYAHEWADGLSVSGDKNATDPDVVRRAVLIHEMGHNIQHQIGRLSPASKVEVEALANEPVSWMDIHKDWDTSSFQRMANPGQLDELKPRWKQDSLRGGPLHYGMPDAHSIYAGEDPNEWFAEAYADGMLNGDNASESGKKVVALARKYLGGSNGSSDTKPSREIPGSVSAPGSPAVADASTGQGSTSEEVALHPELGARRYPLATPQVTEFLHNQEAFLPPGQKATDYISHVWRTAAFDDPARGAQFTSEFNRIEVADRIVNSTPQGEATYASLQEKGWFTDTGQSQLEGVLAHEFGHAIDHRISLQTRKDAYDVIAEHLQIRPVVGAAWGWPTNLQGPVIDGWVNTNRDAVETGISRYAASDPREMFAELWASYTGKHPTPLAKDFGDTVVAGLTADQSLLGDAEDIPPYYTAASSGPSVVASDAAFKDAFTKKHKVEETYSTGLTAMQVQKVVLSDGTPAILKEVRLSGEVRNEVLAAKVGTVLGIPGLKAVDVSVRKKGAVTKNRVLMSFATGDSGAQAIDEVYYSLVSKDFGRDDAEAQVAQGPNGKQIGLLDWLIGNVDRNMNNWLVDLEGKVTPIDHGNAFNGDSDYKLRIALNINPFVTEALGMGPIDYAHRYTLMPMHPTFTSKELDEYEAGLELLRPDFVEWHARVEFNAMMHRLQVVREAVTA